MSWWNQRTPVVIDRRRSLDAVPMRNEGVFEKMRSDDHLELVVIMKRGDGFLARFQPSVMERMLKLDGLGVFVFDQIDDRRTTRNIIDAFVTRFKVNRREAELSCVKFLRNLAERQAISIVVK